MVNRGGYAFNGSSVKPIAGPPSDRILLRLGPGEQAEVLVLTTPSTATRRRLLRFARTLIENPSALALGDSTR